MSNVWDEMRSAVADATNTLRAADDCATDMAWLLKGRLQCVTNPYTLAALKRELAQFDAHKKEWKP